MKQNHCKKKRVKTLHDLSTNTHISTTIKDPAARPLRADALHAEHLHSATLQQYFSNVSHRDI